MIKKLLFLALILSLSFTLLPGHAVQGYTPHQRDYFNYYDIINLNNGTGGYYGYTEHETVNGIERMNQVFVNGTIASNYTYTWNWSNNLGSNQNGKSAGNFTWSSTTFHYVKGTDNQTGYSNPYVWFYMDNTTQQGGTFYLLNTQMTVTSTNYTYGLVGYGNVKALRAQGSGGYQRNYGGIFNAAYTYTTYSDPSTGYIIGYDYVEQDTNSTSSFTWGEALYVTATSYPLTAAPSTPSTNPGFSIPLFLVLGLVFLFIFFIIVVIVAVALSRRRRLPKHQQQFPPTGQYYRPPPGPPPQIDLTPKQPPVEQIVIKEIVKVKCKYCGALIDGTVQACPFCGAPRT